MDNNLKKAEKPLDFLRLYAIIAKLIDSVTAKYGGIAQLGERLNGIQEVSGSIPLISTTKVLKTSVFRTFFFVFSVKKLEVVFCNQYFDHNLTTIALCTMGTIGPICF